MTFVTYDEIEEVIAAVLVTYRELGDRTDRSQRRRQQRAHNAHRHGDLNDGMPLFILHDETPDVALVNEFLRTGQ